jgi:hypothetical protein
VSNVSQINRKYERELPWDFLLQNFATDGNDLVADKRRPRAIREALAVYRPLVPDVRPRRKRNEMANNRAPDAPTEMSKNVDGSGTNVACT